MIAITRQFHQVGVEEQTEGSAFDSASVLYDAEFDEETARLMAKLMNEGKGLDAWIDDPPDWDRETQGVPDFLYDRMLEAGWKDPQQPEGHVPTIRVPGFCDRVVSVPHDRWLAMAEELKAHRDEIEDWQRRIGRFLGEMSSIAPIIRKRESS